ncbi:MAG: hypothetical protein QOF51_1851 [Chloroflexota bacterium]|jgi:ornithine cyclodeaminase|nr:hypothetical protein [Chloroflexota bacterium]
MTLLLSRSDVRDLLSPEQAIEVVAQVVREEAEGTAVHMPPYGGQSGTGIPLRLVGGGLKGLGRMGIRVGLGGAVSVLYDTNSRELLSILASGFGSMRVGATMALAARYLARPDAKVVGMLGSGNNALSILQFLNVVRPLERAEVYSPTPEHRTALAERATRELGFPVTAHDSPDPVIAAAEIMVVATASDEPVLRIDQVRPGTHVTSMGRSTELAESLYLEAAQFVVGSAEQEIQEAQPAAHSKAKRVGGQLWELLQAGRYSRDRIIELGSLVKGDVAPRNGPQDINVFRESRGGVGDIAFANYVYEQAKARGIGTEFSFE